VFVTLDIEAGLDGHSMTEIGIGTFDPVEVAVLMAGEKKIRAEWFLASLEAVHYRIQESASLMITKKLDRRGEKLWAGAHFEFGQSFWISKKEVAKVISGHVDAVSSRNSVNGRDIIVVAHASKNDDQWLKRNGVNLSQIPMIKDTIDTQKLCAKFMSYHRSALSDIVKNLGIDMRYRHNGGNDAMYTQAAMILTMLHEGIQEGAFTVSDDPLTVGQKALDRHRKPTPQMADCSLIGFKVCNVCGKPNHETINCKRLCSLCGQFDHGRIECGQLRLDASNGTLQ
jgi:hypothetical protein